MMGSPKIGGLDSVLEGHRLYPFLYIPCVPA